MAQDGPMANPGSGTEDSETHTVHFDVAPSTIHHARQIARAHPGGGAFAGMADGSVRSVKNAIHEKGVKKHVEVHFDQYIRAGYLEKHEPTPDGKATIWKTTPRFSQANFLFLVYKDIAQYASEENITDAELEQLGAFATMEIHRTLEKKDTRDPITHLYRCCQATGVDNITTTDIAAIFDELPFAKIAKVSLENALAAVYQQTSQMNHESTHNQGLTVAPVLGRLLVLAAICGIRRLQMSDISILLSKAGLFETVVRSRIARLRNHHPSQITNTLLFGGKTESLGMSFIEQAGRPYIMVGRMDIAEKASFIEPWKSCNCVFLPAQNLRQTAGTPIYMPRDWARLLRQRTESKQKGSSLLSLSFIITATPNGELIANPSGNDLFFRKTAPIYRHYGGIVGPVSCGCTASLGKSEVSKTWRHNHRLTVPKLKLPYQFIQHSQKVEEHEMSLLDCRGDWPTGIFLMQALAQSSYLQGRGECLSCALRDAKRTGCYQVVVCGSDPV